MTGYVTGANNRLLQDADWTYEYDDEGNLIKKTSKASPYDEWHYTWDHRNRLVEATLKPHEGVGVLKSVRFTYDVFDRRIQKLADTDGDGLWDSGYKTVFDGDNPYMDFDLTNNVLARYLYGDEMDELYAKVNTAGEVDWYLTDLLGSVRYVVDGATRQVIATMHYDSFGNQLLADDPDLGRFRYTAREWDAETGLQYNRARYYDPAAGRWISEDPIKFKAGDPNLRRYIVNSPLTATDPSGLDGPFSPLPRPVYPPSSNELIDPILEDMDLQQAEKERIKSELKRILDAAKFWWPRWRGPRGSCGPWCQKMMNILEGMRDDTPSRGRFPGYTIDSQDFASRPPRDEEEMMKGPPGHCTLKITFRDKDGNEVGSLYLDDGWKGGSDHLLGPSDIPPGFKPWPDPTITAPVPPPRKPPRPIITYPGGGLCFVAGTLVHTEDCPGSAQSGQSDPSS